MSPLQPDPHAEGEVYRAGVALESARGVVILLHGRGGSAQDILTLAGELDCGGLAFLAPQAAGSTWYPNSFLAPRESNEPRLSSALRKVEAVVALAEAAGIARGQIIVGGFSQGACLSSEFVATHPGRWAGLLAFTGGLIGPEGGLPAYSGHLAGMPALLSSGDPDPHVPWTRVEETAAVLTAMGGSVTLQRYPGRPHTVSAPELAAARDLVAGAFA